MGRRRTGRLKDHTRPPDGEPWVWHQAELLRSPAWRARSINCVRLIEFLLLEHMGHGGMENGRLLAPYSQLEKFGVNRPEKAILEAERLGLVDVERGARRGVQSTDANRYRLTFYATRRMLPSGFWSWHPSTDEWRAYESDRKL